MMRAKRGFIYSFLMVCFLITGCSKEKVIPEEYTVEYGDEKKLGEVLRLVKNEKPSLSVDVKRVGIYHVEITNTKKQKRNVIVHIEDTKIPKIKLKSDKYEYSLSKSFPYKDNIKSIKDDIDGEIKNIEHVSQKEYKVLLEKVKREHERWKKREYHSETDLKMEKDDDSVIHNTILVTSDIKEGRAGNYTGKIAAIDKNYNIREQTFQIAVKQQKKKKGERKETAAGEANASANISEKEQSSYANSTSIPSVSDSVAAAALARIGGHMSCDELVSEAYIASGKISGKNIYNIDFIAANTWTNLGTPVARGNARPGDVIYYQNGGTGSFHVAVYLGNNQAVHGGFFNRNVVRYSVDIGSGPVFYRMPNSVTWDDIAVGMYGKEYVAIQKENAEQAAGNANKQPSPSIEQQPSSPNDSIKNNETEMDIYRQDYELNIGDKTLYISCSVDIEDLVNAYFSQTVDETSFLAQVTQKGCTVQ